MTGTSLHVQVYKCTCGCGVSTDTGRCNISHDVECADFPANTRYSPNAAPMLGQRRRRWTNIGLAVGQSLVFAGLVWDCGHCRLFNFYYVSKCGIHVHTHDTWVSFVIFISVTLHSVTEMKIATLTIQTHDIVILSFISIISDLLYNLELDCNLQCYCILLKLAHMFKTTYITLYSLSICFWGQILIPALKVSTNNIT